MKSRGSFFRLTSLSKITHAVATGNVSSFLMAECCSTGYIHHVSSLPPSTAGHLGGFPVSEEASSLETLGSASIPKRFCAVLVLIPVLYSYCSQSVSYWKAREDCFAAPKLGPLVLEDTVSRRCSTPCICPCASPLPVWNEQREAAPTSPAITLEHCDLVTWLRSVRAGSLYERGPNQKSQGTHNESGRPLYTVSLALCGILKNETVP